MTSTLDVVSETSLRRFLHALPGVDEVGADQRASALSSRSVKTDGALNINYPFVQFIYPMQQVG